LMKET